MKVGARNQLKGKVTDIKRGDVMAQIKEATTGRGIEVARRL
jgi:molybdopterin-binding protein